MALAFLVLAPAVLGLVALSIEKVRIGLAILLGTAAAHLLTVASLWSGGAAPAPDALLRIDVTGLLFLSVTSLLFLAASLYTVPYLLEGTHDAQAAPRRFVPCLLWFLSAMTLVTATQNLALMWAAVE